MCASRQKILSILTLILAACSLGDLPHAGGQLFTGKYHVGGVAKGLHGNLTLRNNDRDELTLKTDGPFSFTETLSDSSSYEVTLKAAPPGQTCRVVNEHGTVTAADVHDVRVECAVWTSPFGLTDYVSRAGKAANSPAAAGVAVNENNEAVIVWEEDRGDGIHEVIRTEYRDGVWHAAEPVSPFNTDAREPQVAGNALGEWIIVWSQRESDSGPYHVFKSEFREGEWTLPSSLWDFLSGPDVESSVESPQVAMDGNGNSLVVWAQTDSADVNRIFRARYSHNDHMWSPAEMISPATDATLPKIAMSKSGDAVMTWMQKDSALSTAKFQIFKSWLHNGVWKDPYSPSDNISPDGFDAWSPQAAMDATGNALIVWYQSNGTQFHVYKSELRSGAWNDPALSSYFSLGGGGAGKGPKAAMSGDGSALIVWYQDDGSGGPTRIYAAQYRDNQWFKPAGFTDYLSVGDKAASLPMAAMDGEGNAVVTWWQVNDSGLKQIFKSELRGGLWFNPGSPADKINADETACTNAPQVAMPASERALIVWSQEDLVGMTHIYKAELDYPR